MIGLQRLVSYAAIALAIASVGCGSNTSTDTQNATGGSAGGSGGGNGGSSGGSSGGGTGGAQSDAAAAATALSLVPKANGVSGWTIDPDSEKTVNLAAATGTTEKQVEDLIDGAAADFFDGFTPVQFAWQNYVNATLPKADVPDVATLKLYILQLPNSSDAAGLYQHMLSANLYARYSTWADPSTPIGTKARMVDTGDHWWINFYKGAFYVEVDVTPSGGPAPDYTPGLKSTKDAAIAFAQAIAAKI